MKFLRGIASVALAVVIMVSGVGGEYASTVTGVISSPTTTGALKNASVAFTLNQGGIVAGSFVLTTSPVVCATDESGNIVGLAEPVVNPTFSVNYGAGSLPMATYYTRLTYWNASGETQPGPESSFVVTSNGTLTVIGPTFQPASASGYKIYMSTSPGAEVLQTIVTGFASHAYLAAINVVPGTLPSMNSTLCDVKFNDTIIPTETVYNVSVTTQNGAIVPGFNQPWYLSGSSLNVTNDYPLAVNKTARFPYPIIANPSSNALQSINSPLTLNGYSLTAGSMVLPNNVSCPSPVTGKTLFCTVAGTAQVSQNGAGYVNLVGNGFGWAVNGTDVRETVFSDSALVGLTTSDLTTQSGGSNDGVLVANSFLYAVNANGSGVSTNARVASLGVLGSSSIAVLASGVSGTQATGWPLTIRVCPSAGDCSMLGTSEVARFPLGGGLLIGLTSSDVAGSGNALIANHNLVVVSATANASIASLGVISGSGFVSIASGKTGSGAYLPIQFEVGGAETMRLSLANNVAIGSTTDDDATQIPLEVVRSGANGVLSLTRNSDVSDVTSYVGLVARSGAAVSTNDVTVGATASSFTPASGLLATNAFILSGASAANGLTLQSKAGTIKLQPGGSTTEMTLTASTGLTLAHALPVTSGGTGSTSAWGATGDILFAGSTTTTSTTGKLQWDNTNFFETVTGGIALAGAARVNPAGGTSYLHLFYDSGASQGLMGAVDYSGPTYKSLKLFGSLITFDAGGADIFAVSTNGPSWATPFSINASAGGTTLSLSSTTFPGSVGGIPYTWLQAVAGDGTVVYIPAYK